MTDVSLPAAAFAGVLSFLSPCVLPLVPPYLCFLAGTTIEEFSDGGERRARRDVLRRPALHPWLFHGFRPAGRDGVRARQMIRQYLDVLSILAGAAFC